ncbi:hypothetical protein [Brazilian marseillevirus]|uniref:hypothetical protein n=1 Tax=Brazilian marseillevirus TaxID=1813599 RepID=UPI000785694A|nr:hypothetical protein A3303_gp032 [Brazilian marseillevirus]AMQ10540.1 hypothetical protein [Brazilian marseillevirus]
MRNLTVHCLFVFFVVEKNPNLFTKVIVRVFLGLCGFLPSFLCRSIEMLGECDVCLDDRNIPIRDVIFPLLSLDDNRGSANRRQNRKGCDDEPLRASRVTMSHVCGENFLVFVHRVVYQKVVETQEATVFVRDVLEDGQERISWDAGRFRLVRFGSLCSFSRIANFQMVPFKGEDRNLLSAVWTSLNAITILDELLQPCVSLMRQNAKSFTRILGDENTGALEADALENASENLGVMRVNNGFLQRDMTEMSGTVDGLLPASFADPLLVKSSHPFVIDSPFITHIGVLLFALCESRLLRDNLTNRVAQNFSLRRNTELDCANLHLFRGYKRQNYFVFCFVDSTNKNILFEPFQESHVEYLVSKFCDISVSRKVFHSASSKHRNTSRV